MTSKSIRKVLSFSLIGVGVAGIGFVEMYVFIDLFHFDKNLSYFLQSLISLHLNFAFNAWVTWKDVKGDWWQKLWKFHSSRITIAVLCQILFGEIVVFTGYPVAYALTIVLASVFNFISSDKWVFTKKIQNPQKEWRMLTQSTDLVSDVTIVIPTRNEAGVITPLLSMLEKAMADSIWKWNVLIVDDSTDDTPAILEELSQCFTWLNFIHRSIEDRTGLGTAILLGIQKSQGRYVQLMDADGQHPPAAVRRMIDEGLSRNLDLIMSTRYGDTGQSNGLDGFGRRLFSEVLRWLPRILFPSRLLYVTDPLAGMFLVKKETLLLEKITPIGWKISLEVMLFSKTRDIVELPIQFEDRLGGKSKADLVVGVSYFKHLLSLTKRYYFPHQEKQIHLKKSQRVTGGL